MSDRRDSDVAVVAGAAVVFGLPLTLLIPDFSVWSLVPKLKVTRFHVFSQCLTWSQLNGVIVILMVFLFCLYLEIRKRKLDDMVEKVLKGSQATDSAMLVERDRQATTMSVSVDLLDSSAEHYENLVLLRDELRQREQLQKQQPPQIEPSCSNI